MAADTVETKFEIDSVNTERGPKVFKRNPQSEPITENPTGQMGVNNTGQMNYTPNQMDYPPGQMGNPPGQMGYTPAPAPSGNWKWMTANLIISSAVLVAVASLAVYMTLKGKLFNLSIEKYVFQLTIFSLLGYFYLADQIIDRPKYKIPQYKIPQYKANKQVLNYVHFLFHFCHTF